MLSRLKETIRSEKTLADEIRLPLVDGLFYPFASLIVGALTVLWIAATVTILVEDLWVQAVADFTLVIALARIAIGFRYISLKKAADRSNVDFWEGAYALGAALFSAGLGILCMLAILRVENARAPPDARRPPRPPMPRASPAATPAGPTSRSHSSISPPARCASASSSRRTPSTRSWASRSSSSCSG